MRYTLFTVSTSNGATRPALMSKDVVTHAMFAARMAFAALVAATALGCEPGGGEGDRCNPDRSSNECGDGLTCGQPPFCPESYCCPANVTPSSNAFCQPGCAGGAASACAAGDLPSCIFLDGGDAASSSANSGDVDSGEDAPTAEASSTPGEAGDVSSPGALDAPAEADAPADAGVE